MEKYLNETKALQESARVLHEVCMKTASVSLEEIVAMEKLQLEREAELHAAKIRNEELQFSMQRELHSIRMHTAVLERDQAEVNGRILELKMQQVLLELEKSQRPS